MPINNFSTGRDLTLTVTTPSGNLVFPLLTDFAPKPIFKEIDSTGIDGTPRFAEMPAGWEGTLKIDRQSNVVDVYFAQLEAAYFSGQNIQSGTILETITEASGSVSQFRYDGVVLKLDNPGDWSGDKKVEQSISFKASHKTQVT